MRVHPFSARASSSAGPGETQIQLLGPVGFMAACRVLPLRGMVPKAVLAFLAGRPGHGSEIDDIVDAIWGVDPPRTARQMVINGVSQVRSVLARDARPSRPVIATYGRSAYAIEVAPECIDAIRYQALVVEAEASVAAGDVDAGHDLLAETQPLWRGLPLTDIGAAAFVPAERSRLLSVRLSAEQLRLLCALRTGRGGTVVAEIGPLLTQSPFTESLRWLLIAALASVGQTADALAAYREVRALWVNELGLEPAHLRELERSILAGDLLPTFPWLAVPLGTATPKRSARA